MKSTISFFKMISTRMDTLNGSFSEWEILQRESQLSSTFSIWQNQIHCTIMEWKSFAFLKKQTRSKIENGFEVVLRFHITKTTSRKNHTGIARITILLHSHTSFSIQMIKSTFAIQCLTRIPTCWKTLRIMKRWKQITSIETLCVEP